MLMSDRRLVSREPAARRLQPGAVACASRTRLSFEQLIRGRTRIRRAGRRRLASRRVRRLARHRPGQPGGHGPPDEPRRVRDEARARRGSTTRIRSSRAICGAQVHGAALRSRDARRPRTPAPASTSSSFPTSPAPTRSSGCGPARRPLICEAMGKRLCDAHEWEGACAGSLGAAGLPLRPRPRSRSGVRRARHARRPQPRRRSPRRSGATAPPTAPASAPPRASRPRAATAAAGPRCGSNTFPTGAFPDCRSPLGVYDLHGNAAEHMNLPLEPDQMASRGQHGARLHRDEGELVHLRHATRPTRTRAAGARPSGTAAG